MISFFNHILLLVLASGLILDGHGMLSFFGHILVLVLASGLILDVGELTTANGILIVAPLAYLCLPHCRAQLCQNGGIEMPTSKWHARPHTCMHACPRTPTSGKTQATAKLTPTCRLGIARLHCSVASMPKSTMRAQGKTARAQGKMRENAPTTHASAENM